MTEVREINLEKFISNLVNECNTLLDILSILGLPYMELQQLVKNLVEDNYTDYLEHTLSVMSTLPGYDEKYNKIQKLLEGTE